MMDFSKFFDPSANKDGFTFGQPSAEYFAQPAINASTLKAPTPLEMLYKLRHEFDPLKYPLMFGSLVHKAILEPDDFDSDKRDSWLIILTTKSLTTKEAKSAHEANPGMVIATPEMVEKAARCKEAAWKHKQLRWCLEQPGNSEVSATAWNEATNCWRKCRIDWLPKDRTCGWILDLKTTMASVGSLWALNGEIRKWGYDISARHYTEIAAQLGHPCAHFAFAWIEGPTGVSQDAKSAPYIARMTALGREPDEQPSLLSVQPTYDFRIGAFCNAASTGVWDAHENETITLGNAF